MNAHADHPARAGSVDAQARHLHALVHLCTDAAERLRRSPPDVVCSVLEELARRLREDGVEDHVIVNLLVEIVTAIELDAADLDPGLEGVLR